MEAAAPRQTPRSHGGESDERLRCGSKVHLRNSESAPAGSPPAFFFFPLRNSGHHLNAGGRSGYRLLSLPPSLVCACAFFFFSLFSLCATILRFLCLSRSRCLRASVGSPTPGGPQSQHSYRSAAGAATASAFVFSRSSPSVVPVRGFAGKSKLRAAGSVAQRGEGAGLVQLR